MVQLFVVVVTLLCALLAAIQVRQNHRTQATARAAQAEAERIVRHSD